MTTDVGEDITNDEGEQLYAVYIEQKPKKEKSGDEKQGTDGVSEEADESAQQETQDPSQNGEEQGDKAPTTEAEEDYEKLFEE
jgi:hypothetical protein